MLISTLSSKGQATIPADVRKSLKLKAGDKVSFEILEHQVVIRKARAFDRHYHEALSQTLSEWDSIEDDEAYRDL